VTDVNITAGLDDSASPGLKRLIGLLGEFAQGVREGAKAELEAQRAGGGNAERNDATSASLTRLAGGLAKVAAGFYAAKQVVDAFVASVHEADRLDDLSDKTGVAASQLQSLGYAAKLSGSSLDGVVTAMNKLGRSAVASEEDVKKQAAAFEAVGVSATDANGQIKDSQTLFLELATAFSQIEDSPEKAAAAFRIFGSEAKNLMPLLNQGAEGIQKLRKEQEELAGVDPGTFDKFAKSSGSLFDGIDKITVAINGLFTAIGAELVPALVVMVDEIVDSAKEGGLLRNVLDGLAAVVNGVLVPAIKVAAVIFSGFTSTVKIAGASIGAFFAVIQQVASGGGLKGVKQVLADYKDEVDRIADAHVKFTEKLALSGHEAVKLASATDKPKRTIKAVGKEAKDTTKALEDMVSQLRVANASFGADESVKQRLEAQEKFAEAIKKGADPARAAALRDQALALIDVNRALREAAKEQEAFEKAQASLDEQQAQNALLAYEASLIGLQADERARLVQAYKDEQAVRKAVADLSDADAKKVADRMRALQAERAEIQKAADDARVTNEILSQSHAFIQEDVQRRLMAAVKLLEAGKITVDDYTKYQDAQLDRLKDKTKEVTSEIQTFWKAAGEGIQGDLQSFIFDFAQGKLSNLVSSVKTTLDRIVAQILAAKLATALFGSDFAKGNVGGLVGQAGGFLAGLFGGFRAAGGPVQAGRAYVVGERRAELFVPSTSGRILPDAGAVGASAGPVVNLSVTAMDSQSVIQAIAGVKREVAGMLNATTRTYNLRSA
jgi:hypothetical protein